MIIFVGLAGSGKTLQGRLLTQKIGAIYVSIGELLRENVDPEIKEKMLTGELIGDDDVIKLLDLALPAKDQTMQESILDGFPRTLKQVEWLVQQVKKGRIKVNGVIHLIASPDVVVPRLLERSRPDDHMEAIKVRIDEYNQMILPIIQRLKGEGIKVYDVNGEQTIEEVQKEIITKLNLDIR